MNDMDYDQDFADSSEDNYHANKKKKKIKSAKSTLDSTGRIENTK